jgi:hypothetical protein
MGKIGAARDRLATGQGAALNDPSPPQRLAFRVLNEEWPLSRKSHCRIATFSTIAFIQLGGAVIGFQRAL